MLSNDPFIHYLPQVKGDQISEHSLVSTVVFLYDLKCILMKNLTADYFGGRHLTNQKSFLIPDFLAKMFSKAHARFVLVSNLILYPRRVRLIIYE